jgi:C1A family cysteine protease
MSAVEPDRSNICNLEPSPFDGRDWKFESRVNSVVANVKMPNEFLCSHLRKIKDQGRRGTCVAMTLSCMKEVQETFELPELKDDLMSPNSLYFYRKPESGMYCRNAMKILQEKGMCLEKTFPYTMKEEPEAIPEEAIKEASNYVIKSYARVDTIEGAKKALVEFGPLMIAFPYYSNGKPEFWQKPSIDSPVDGGHAVAVVGWNKEGFVLRNSWGENWNGDGHVVYPFAEWGAHWELWSSIDDKKNYVPPHILADRTSKFCRIFMCGSCRKED